MAEFIYLKQNAVAVNKQLTLREGQQQQRRQSSDDGREQKHTAPTKVVDRQADEDARQGAGYHAEEIAKVEVWGITVKVSGETVLDACSNEPEGEIREMHPLWRPTLPTHARTHTWPLSSSRRRRLMDTSRYSQREAQDEAVLPDNARATKLQNRKVSWLTVFSVRRIDL